MRQTPLPARNLALRSAGPAPATIRLGRKHPIRVANAPSGGSHNLYPAVPPALTRAEIVSVATASPQSTPALRSNRHSARCTRLPQLPRLRALALLRRRPSARGESPASRRPRNLHICRSRAHSQAASAVSESGNLKLASTVNALAALGEPWMEVARTARDQPYSAGHLPYWCTCLPTGGNEIKLG